MFQVDPVLLPVISDSPHVFTCPEKQCKLYMAGVTSRDFCLLLHVCNEIKHQRQQVNGPHAEGAGSGSLVPVLPTRKWIKHKCVHLKYRFT